MDKIKRNRSSNWSESDKALLTQLIKDKIHLVENKDVSRNNNQIKKSAWQEILQSYNTMSDTKRDLPQLLNQWRNTKNNVKKRYFEYRRNCNATGGGPRPPSPPPEDVEIMDILPNEFKIDQNIFDSDSLANGQSASDAKMFKNSMDIILEQPECSSSMPPTQTVQVPTMQLTDEEHKTPSKIITNRTKKRARFAAESSKSEELFMLAKSGREQQIQQQKKEHEFKMKIMEEEHEMRMKILKKELEYWEKKQDEQK